MNINYQLIDKTRHDGDFLKAAGLSFILLDNNPLDPGAIHELFMILPYLGMKDQAMDIGVRLVKIFAYEGNLPSALVVYLQLKELNYSEIEKTRQLLSEIFSNKSTTLKDSTPKPPPLPSEISKGKFHEIEFKEVAEKTEKLITDIINWEKEAVISENIPFYPFICSLDEKEFGNFIDGLILLDLEENKYVVREGNNEKTFYLLARGEVKVEKLLKDNKIKELARLGSGAFFGEIALLSDMPRQASVITLVPTLILVATKELVDEIIKSNPKVKDILIAFARKRMLANLFNTSGILKTLSPENRIELLKQFVPQKYDENKKIIIQGQDSEGLFLIFEGEVEVWRNENDKELLLATLSSGDVFGEISLVLKKPATATVIAKKETTVLILSTEKFHALIKKYPQVLAHLYELALNREEEITTTVVCCAGEIEDLVLI